MRVTPAGHRHVVVQDPGVAVPDLAGQARRLGRGLDAVVVLLVPDAQAGALRVGVSVPDGLAPRIPATAVLDRALAVTGGRGGGGATFAQGGGAQPGDLPGVMSRIWAALGGLGG